MQISDNTAVGENKYRYRVAILDDEPEFARSLEVSVRQILTQAGIPHRISIYFDSAALLADASHSSDSRLRTEFGDDPECVPHEFDCLLLDILMEGFNGMRLAGRLREAGCRAAIIFITSTEDFALEGYRVEALRYLLKPVDLDSLKELLLSDYQRHFQGKDLSLRLDGEEYIRVSPEEILYVETILRKVCIHLLTPENGEVLRQSPERLSQLEALLPPTQFICCRRGILVNLEHVCSIRRFELTLKNGSRIPVSRQSYDAVKKAYFRYLRW